ncbi:MAG: hypothetical protein V4576_04330 [Patescibacteria group bacterium]
MEFDESQFKLRSRRILGEPEVPAMIKFLVTHGIVKTEKQAIGMLLSAVIALIIISVVVAKSNSVQPASIDIEYQTARAFSNTYYN